MSITYYNDFDFKIRTGYNEPYGLTIDEQLEVLYFSNTLNNSSMSYNLNTKEVSFFFNGTPPSLFFLFQLYIFCDTYFNNTEASPIYGLMINRTEQRLYFSHLKGGLYFLSYPLFDNTKPLKVILWEHTRYKR